MIKDLRANVQSPRSLDHSAPRAADVLASLATTAQRSQWHLTSYCAGSLGDTDSANPNAQPHLHLSLAPGCSKLRRAARRLTALHYVSPVPP